MEETFDPVKNLNELVLSISDISDRLGALDVKWVAKGRHEGYGLRGVHQSLQRPHLLVGTPESSYYDRNSSREFILILTSPTPWPTVDENAYRTFTVGVTHFVRRSSPFWDWLNAGIRSRRAARTASGESQD